MITAPCDQFILFDFGTGGSSTNGSLSSVYPFTSTQYGVMSYPGWNEFLHVVTSDVRSVRQDNAWNCAVGNTSGTGDDRYLLVNGSPNTGEVFRMENIGVIAGNTYDFGLDRNEVCLNYHVNPPEGCPYNHKLRAKILDSSNGAVLSNVDWGEPAISCQWYTESGTFTAPSSGAVTLVIMEEKQEAIGTDFAIDNIFFRTDSCPSCIEEAACISNSGYPGEYDVNCDCICNLQNPDFDCDSDGLRNGVDCDPNDPAINFAPRFTCDDGSNLTDRDAIDENCNCVGQPILCVDLNNYGETCDYDGDGIPNINDIDDDNDGILDVDESLSFIQSCSSYTSGRINGVTIGVTNNGGTPNWSAAQVSSFDPQDVYGVCTIYGNIYTQDRTSMYIDNNDCSSDWSLIIHFVDINNFAYSRFPLRLSGLSNFDYMVALSGNVSVSGVEVFPTDVSQHFEGSVQVFFSSCATGNSSFYFDADWWFERLYIALSICRQQSAGSADSDNDGVLNQFDSDSDDDGCPDAIEGGEAFTLAQLNLNNNINVIGGPQMQLGALTDIDANGVPNLASGGQAIGSSKDASTQDASCSTASLMASDDTYSGTAGDIFATVYVNDDANGTSPATDMLVTTPRHISGDLSSISFNTDGTFTIPALTPNGTYTFIYEICLEAEQNFCSQAEVSLVLNNQTGLYSIEAVSDILSALPGDPISSILVNDIANGVMADNASVTTPTVLNDGGLSGFSINSDGTAIVPPNATPGEYTIQYQICLELENSYCSEANIVLTVVNPCEISGTLSVRGVSPTTCGGINGYLEITGLNMGSLSSVNAIWTGVAPQSATGLSQTGAVLIISGQGSGTYDNLRIVDPNDPTCYADVTLNH